jgi:serine/threonine protein kinase
MLHQHITSHTFLHIPSVARFFFSFQDAGYLYMCMDLAPGGELLGLITANLNDKLSAGVENQACSYDMTKFYIAEVVQGLAYLHERNIIHRDLKPESEWLSLFVLLE